MEEIFILYRSGSMGRVGMPQMSGVEEKAAWLAGLHPELNFFWAPAGSVETT